MSFVLGNNICIFDALFLPFIDFVLVSTIIESAVYTVMHITFARKRIGKQARNKYATNNRVDPLLGNAHNNITYVARDVFYLGPRHALR
jgi:hypothetical protein